MKNLLIIILLPTLMSCSLFDKDNDTGQAAAAPLASIDRSLASAADSPVAAFQNGNGDLDRVLQRHKITEPKASEIKQLVKEHQKTSAVRELKYATELSLPQAKAVVDTLFNIAHGEPIGS